MLNKAYVVLPLVLFLMIVILLGRGLTLHPSEIPSPLINQPAPVFELPQLLRKTMTTQNDFLGHVTLVNVWATWCYACSLEHPFLMALAHAHSVMIYGLDYKDNPYQAREWLKEHGNPYDKIAVDETGNVAIDWGVYGTPETFILDKKGRIRYKQIGAITPESWQRDMQPVVEQLQQE